eukprot:sb/3478882/
MPDSVQPLKLFKSHSFQFPIFVLCSTKYKTRQITTCNNWIFTKSNHTILNNQIYPRQLEIAKLSNLVHIYPHGNKRLDDIQKPTMITSINSNTQQFV